VVLGHIIGQFLEHLLILVQPMSAGDTQSVANALHAGQDQANAVLRSVEQMVSSLLIEMAGLKPAKQRRAAHGALNDAVLDLYIANLPRRE